MKSIYKNNQVSVLWDIFLVHCNNISEEHKIQIIRSRKVLHSLNLLAFSCLTISMQCDARVLYWL